MRRIKCTGIRVAVPGTKWGPGGWEAFIGTNDETVFGVSGKCGSPGAARHIATESLMGKLPPGRTVSIRWNFGLRSVIGPTEGDAGRVAEQ